MDSGPHARVAAQAPLTIDVRVPATSANLGPGFDVLGLALGLYNDIVYEEADRVVVAVEGEGAGRLDTGAGNVVARAAGMAYEAAGRRFPGATIRCINRIPPARGFIGFTGPWIVDVPVRAGVEAVVAALVVAAVAVVVTWCEACDNPGPSSKLTPTISRAGRER